MQTWHDSGSQLYGFNGLRGTINILSRKYFDTHAHICLFCCFFADQKWKEKSGKKVELCHFSWVNFKGRYLVLEYKFKLRLFFLGGGALALLIEQLKTWQEIGWAGGRCWSDTQQRDPGLDSNPRLLQWGQSLCTWDARSTHWVPQKFTLHLCEISVEWLNLWENELSAVHTVLNVGCRKVQGQCEN